MLRGVLGGVGVVALMGVWPGAALATGGPNITSAPSVSYGVQEFGNTATDTPPNPSTDSSDSWWQLPVIAGDDVTVNYEAQHNSAGQQTITTAYIYPPETTDFNVSSANPVTQGAPDSSGYGQLRYTASRDGTLPLDFFVYDWEVGPYSFTAYITHEIVLGLTTTSDAKRHSATFTVATHNPDGAAIAQTSLRAMFQLRVRGHWQTLKIVRSRLRLTETWSSADRGHRQSVRVLVSGPTYRTATASVHVRAR